MTSCSNRSTNSQDQRIGRHHVIRTHGSGFSLGAHAAPPQKIDTAIVRNPKKPGFKGAAIVVLVQLSIGFEESVLNYILAIQHRPVIREQ